MSISTSITVILNCTSCSLNALITFKDINNLSFYGGNKATAIQCELSDEVLGPGAGLAYQNASNILLSNLIFVGCGGLQKSTSRTSDSLHFRSALYFERCTNVSCHRLLLRTQAVLA